MYDPLSKYGEGVFRKKKICHCEPVRTLAWQSPKHSRNS